MQINYLGHACFKIKTQNINLVIDPFDNTVGFKMAKTQADIVAITHEHKDHNNLAAIEGTPFIIRAPGEYEIKGVSVIGLSSFHDKSEGRERGKNTIYIIRSEEMSLCHLGDLGVKLSQSELDEINGVDVLFVPVGGIYTIDPKEAVEVINAVEPSFAIPMHYNEPQIPNHILNKGFSLEQFLNEANASQAKRMDKLIIAKNNLPEETEIIVLNRR